MVESKKIEAFKKVTSMIKRQNNTQDPVDFDLKDNPESLEFVKITNLAYDYITLLEKVTDNMEVMAKLTSSLNAATGKSYDIKAYQEMRNHLSHGNEFNIKMDNGRALITFSQGGELGYEELKRIVETMRTFLQTECGLDLSTLPYSGYELNQQIDECAQGKPITISPQQRVKNYITSLLTHNYYLASEFERVKTTAPDPYKYFKGKYLLLTNKPNIPNINSNDETEISVSDYSIDNLDPESFENFLDGFVSYFASSSFFVGDEDFSVEVEEDSNANSNQEESSNQNRKKFDDSPVAKSLRKTFPHMSEKFNQEYIISQIKLIYEYKNGNVKKEDLDLEFIQVMFLTYMPKVLSFNMSSGMIEFRSSELSKMFPLSISSDKNVARTETSIFPPLDHYIKKKSTDERCKEFRDECRKVMSAKYKRIRVASSNQVVRDLPKKPLECYEVLKDLDESNPQLDPDLIILKKITDVIAATYNPTLSNEEFVRKIVKKLELDPSLYRDIQGILSKIKNQHDISAFLEMIRNSVIHGSVDLSAHLQTNPEIIGPDGKINFDEINLDFQDNSATVNTAGFLFNFPASSLELIIEGLTKELIDEPSYEDSKDDLFNRFQKMYELMKNYQGDGEYGNGGFSRYTIDKDILDEKYSIKPSDIVNGINEMLRDLLRDINKDEKPSDPNVYSTLENPDDGDLKNNYTKEDNKGHRTINPGNSSNGKSYDSRDSKNPIEPYDPDTYGEK